jgi:hypothetical protein
MYVRKNVCIHERLATAKTVVGILLIFDIQEFIRHRSVPGKYGHSSYEKKKPSDGAQTLIRNFMINGSHNFD